MHRLIKLLPVFILILGLGACGAALRASNSTPSASSPAPDSFTFGVDDGCAPYCYFDKNTKQYEGISVDVARLVAKLAGYKAQCKELPLKEQFKGLLNGQIDVIIIPSAMGEGGDVTFSQAFMTNRLSFFVLRSSGIKNRQDLAGKRIGLLSGGNFNGPSPADISDLTRSPEVYSDAGGALDGLSGGVISAFLADEAYARYALRDRLDVYDVVRDGAKATGYRAVFRSADRELAARFKDGLAKAIDNGDMSDILKMWLRADMLK